MNRIFRLLILVAIALVVMYAGQLLRQIMASELTYQSFWHYLVRVVLILSAGIAGVLLLGRFSVYNPSEVIGSPPTPEVGFKYSNFAKRFTDVGVAFVLLLLLSPVLLVIPLLIFIVEGYPVFYISKRYISLSNCVSVLKFRTMVRDATSPKYRLRERFMRSGYLDIPLSCEVYTPLGRILERTQLVEILQLFNVLLHGMSLIGNRPLPLDNIKLLQQFEGWEPRPDSPESLRWWASSTRLPNSASSWSACTPSSTRPRGRISSGAICASPITRSGCCSPGRRFRLRRRIV